MKITAIIPTLNEEQHIAEAINSVSFADEIIVIDSYSTDKTKEIAKSFSVNFIEREFDDFSSQKNYAIDKAKHSWVFILDADERVTQELENEILQTVNKKSKIVAYWIYRSTNFMGKQIKYSGLQNDKVIRLFKKEFCKYNGKLVHEEIETKNEVGFLKNKLNHSSYKGFDEIIQKRNNYAALQAKGLYAKGLKPNVFHFFIKPFFRFCKHFFIKRGFLDGYRGAIISTIYAYTVFVRYVKLWLLRKNIEVDKINNDFPIDVVFTWVDGGDEKHREKMRPFYKGKDDWKNKKFKTRYDQVNEIEYAVKSVVKFAPYIKSIFIVTDEQIPSFLSSYNQNKIPSDPTIKIIDHKDIFSEQSSFLPVFNSIAIETMLYKIPNLSEHFVYFNDDFSLIKKTQPADFFINGLPVLRGKWTLFDENIFYKRGYNKILKLLGKPIKAEKYGYKRGQQNAVRLLGFKKKYFKIDHSPSPMRKSTLANYYNEFPEIQELNIKHRFRNPKQYVLQTLSNHLEIKNNSGVLKEHYQLLYLGSYKKPLIWYKIKIRNVNKNKNILFLCLQSLDNCPRHKLDYILGWLNKLMSIKS